MRHHFLTGSLLAGMAIAMLAGCGTTTAIPSVQTTSVRAQSVSRLGVPTPDQFTTIQATVQQLLPDTNHGLPHQNFIVQETSPDAGMVLEVNNDEKFGTRVANLQVGEALVIRGILYHDPNQDGIHWTHHTNALNDAGFIETPDGHIYQ